MLDGSENCKGPPFSSLHCNVDKTLVEFTDELTVSFDVIQQLCGPEGC